MNPQTTFNYVWTTPCESHEGHASSISEALAILSQASGSPTMVEFFDPASGLAIALGVGTAASVVTFQESNDPPYYISLGDHSASGVLEFVYGNEPTEYLARNAVSNEAARGALDWFFKNGSRSTLFPWESL